MLIQLAENAGFGFDKIESNWLKYNKTKPSYTIDFDSTIIKLPIEHTHENTTPTEKWGENKEIKWTERWVEKWAEITIWWSENLGVKLSANELKIVDIIAVTPDISITKLSEVIGIVTTSVENNIKKLKQKQIISHVGSAKGGIGKLSSPNSFGHKL